MSEGERLEDMTYDERHREAATFVKAEASELIDAVEQLGSELACWEMEAVAMKVQDALKTFRKCLTASTERQANRRIR